MRTLIVDDLPDMRFLMRASLWTDNVLDITDEAANGEDALAVWRESKPDVIVLDMQMPGLSGLEVAREILEEDPTQAVVMCSAYMDRDDVAEATKLGVAACVDKYAITTLPDVVTSVLGFRLRAQS
ncbi:MAG: response regulator [Frankiaceae bacterium]|nr:response regulator [Frankiaceae bacterium]